MSEEIREIYIQFIAQRFPHSGSAYHKEWETRFEKGTEWQYSDYSSRAVSPYCGNLSEESGTVASIK